jgi:MFS family permease
MGSFDSLRYRDYRLLWTGAVLSNIGTWMQAIALSWYVFELTHSAFWVSFVTFANFVPAVFAPIGGVYTDRMDRKLILLAAQTFMMVDAAVLAVLAWTGRASLFGVMALTFGQGLGFALNAPAWQAFLPSLVPPEAMVNAIALNSAQYSVARVIGPAIAGVLIATVGAGLVFGINAVSFVAVLVALALVRGRRSPPATVQSVRELLVGGFAYAWGHRLIRAMIGVIAVQAFFAAPVTALLPLFAADVFRRGAGGYGGLAAAMGVGAVLGALLLGRLGNRVTQVFVAAAMANMGAVLVVFSTVRSYVAGLFLMVLYGVGFLVIVAGTNSAIQLQVDEGVRGRVISIWLLAIGGFYPLGSLLAGAIAQAVGAPTTTLVGALVSAAWGLGLLWRLRVSASRPLPEPAV